MMVPTDPTPASAFHARPEAVHGPASPSQAEGARAGTGPRLLLVDDHQPSRQLLRALLRHLACTIDEAADGAAAFTCCREHRYDLVVMDVEMPGMDGHAATAAIRQWERTQGRAATPIVALSANDSPEDAQASLAAGCTAHLTKPVDRRELARIVNRCAPAATAAQGVAPRATVARELESLVPRFLGEVRAACATTAAAIANGDWSTVRSVAHQLKGAGGTYGFGPISSAGERLGAAGRAADSTAASRALQQLTAYLQTVEITYE